ncbi:MAG: T9SS type A sorting domain-containing protein [Rhizobiales bacterium]|nr:T9SS type A sorting domain-containing protein [Hyphomicrobiales bacterium]
MSTTANGNIISANAIGATYQWVDCDNGYAPIAGANSQLFAPTQNGNYAVITTINGCSDTSNCEVIGVIGIDELVIGNLILCPNPTNGMLNIGFEGEIKSIVVVDMLGRVISLPISVTEKMVDGSNLSTGKYMIRIITENNQILVEEFVVHK